eukprot:SAG22_NODE_262_length_13373_cov_11.716965_5_plen_131_part_00
MAEHTPLHLACVAGNVPVVQLLLEYAANPEQVDKAGFYPFHHAVAHKNKDVVEFLLMQVRGGPVRVRVCVWVCVSWGEGLTGWGQGGGHLHDMLALIDCVFSLSGPPARYASPRPKRRASTRTSHHIRTG